MATRARIKYIKDVKGFNKHITNINSKELKWNVDNFLLKKSELLPSGPTYTTLETFNTSPT